MDSNTWVVILALISLLLAIPGAFLSVLLLKDRWGEPKGGSARQRQREM